MITPVLLCGGSGTRLWPLSREGFPKQFGKLLGERSLFALSAQRLSGPGFAAPIVVTGSDFRFVVTEQLIDVGIDPSAVIIEPSARNTAPAVIAAALYLAAKDPNSIMLISPSDHAIADEFAFCETVKSGIPAALTGEIVTFGITPTRPETGYGWLELGEGGGAVQPLKGFLEKPSAERARAMMASGGFLWNSGIFLSTARTMVDAFAAYAPSLLADVQASLDAATVDLGFLRLNSEAWSKATAISIDYAVMEHADNLSVVPFVGRWTDLGGWDAVAMEMGADLNGNSLHGGSTAIECHSTLLRSEDAGIELVGIGLDNIIAIAMNDAVLVANRSRAQDVKKAVAALKARGAKQAVAFQTDHRPWGWFETLARADRFQVKRIVVKPGASLSLQSHMHRSEHWIVVSGTARVTIDSEVYLVSENQSAYIPLGAKHRLENPGKVQMVLIEVQTGAYLDEDDITRYEDAYARGQGAKG